MLSNWVTTSTTAEALWMEKCSHASQIIAIAYVTFATIAYPASIHKKNMVNQVQDCKTHNFQKTNQFICFSNHCYYNGYDGI
jgi:hypothetical protein